jgi:peptide/nickel transport system permease protein
MSAVEMHNGSASRRVGFVAGVVITGFFAGVAVVAQFWTPYDPGALSIIDKLQAPNLHHWFGTDQLGRDVLIMRGNDLVFAFPSLLLAILITAVFGPGAVNAIIAIGIFNIPVFARVTRGGALQLWTRDYCLAARVAGKGSMRISVEHVLPNLVGLLAVQGTIQFSLGVIAEAGLSYVGLGAQPPTPSWGRMLNEAQTLTALAPSLALFPGVAVLLFVLGLNLLGDGLRQRRERAQ